MKGWGIIATAWLFSLAPLFAQPSIQVQSGIGFPELLHGGISYHWAQDAMGVTLGTLPDDYSQFISISPYYKRFFGRSGRLNPQPPWYVYLGCTYLRDCNDKRIITDILLSPRVGRHFFISRQSGLSLYGGLSLSAFHYVRKLETTSSQWFDLDLHFPILPSAGLTVFFRF